MFAEIDAERYPRLAAVAGEWVELAGQDTYREGLEALVAAPVVIHSRPGDTVG